MNPLRAIGWRDSDPASADTPAASHAPDPRWAAMQAAHPESRPARVIAQHRSGYIVAEGPGDGHAAESPAQWQRPPSYRKGNTAAEDRAAVGDWVLVTGAPERSEIVALLPRYAGIKRAAAGEHYKQQVIAANVDVVLVVCGLDADFNPRRIERYLLLVQGSGATPVVVLTKADACDDIDAALAELSDIAAQDVAIVTLNARDRDAVRVLDRWLGPGTTAVLVGSSGAGKSTLTNSLLGIDRMKTAAVRESDARGRHTTTHRALIPLSGGACLIDTPGMRELKPTGEEAVAESFDDIEQLATRCRFRDCVHAKEPGCAVRAAIDAGELDPARYAHFLKLRDEVAVAADKLATRLLQQAGEPAQGAAARKRPPPRSGRR